MNTRIPAPPDTAGSSQAAMGDSNPNVPTFLFDDLPFHWQMTRCEKFAFAGILEVARPDVAIEVGTYKGGSLQVISRHARKVYSIDPSPDCGEVLGPHLANVEFLAGRSDEVLPSLLRSIEESGESLGFVLIDGDHSTKGVKSDIEMVLRHRPTRPVYVVFHDSFHPRSRKGLLEADWNISKHVHYVEIDFVPGVYHFEAFDTARPRSMYGGLALAVLLPEERDRPLVIHQSQKGLFDTVFRRSCHYREGRPSARNLIRRIVRKAVHLGR